MIRDYWVYQKRQSETAQWALYIVKEYDRRNADAVTLDYTLYSEDIPTQTHSTSKVGLHYGNVTGYVDDILCEIAAYSTVHADDKAQLEKEIFDILMDR